MRVIALLTLCMIFNGRCVGRHLSFTKLGLFNLIIGFGGYTLRAYSINKVSTVVFSLLSFVGVLSSYAFGKLFVGETSSWKTYLGAMLIAFSAAGVTFV